MATHKIAVLPGDGIGQEVTPQAQRILQVVGGAAGIGFEFEPALVGGSAIDAINVLNTPRWQDPVTDINSPNFGRMTAADPSGSFQQSDTVNGARTFTINMRVNF